MDLKWGKRAGKAELQHFGVLSWEMLVSSLGRVQKRKDVPGEVQSYEAPSRHPYSKPPRRVITSNLVP